MNNVRKELNIKDKNLNTIEYINSVINKIDTIIPQTSIIGMLLEHEEEYIVIKIRAKKR